MAIATFLQHYTKIRFFLCNKKVAGIFGAAPLSRVPQNENHFIVQKRTWECNGAQLVDGITVDIAGKTGNVWFFERKWFLIKVAGKRQHSCLGQLNTSAAPF